MTAGNTTINQSRWSHMDHWTEVYESPAEAKAKSADIFAKYFIVEDDEGSILRDDLYDIYLKWTAESGHKPAGKREFFGTVNNYVSPKLTAMTFELEWVQRFDGIALSTVEAF